MDKARYIWRKKRMLNKAEYRKQHLQSQQTERDRKYKAMEDDLLHVDARKEADRLAKLRRVMKEVDETRNAQVHQEIIEKVHQRYFSYNFLYLIYYRISKLNTQFVNLQTSRSSLCQNLMFRLCTKNILHISTNLVGTLCAPTVVVILMTL